MVWGQITRRVEPPQKGIEESLSDFYDVQAPGIYSLIGLVDIKEGDDTVIDVAVHNGAAYIMQWVTNSGVVLKKLTTSYTYIYNLFAFPWISIFGSRTPYGTMEILDDNTVIFGDIYIDLDKLLLFLLREQLSINVPFKLLGHVANYSSLKRINTLSWVRMYTDEKLRRTYLLYQRSSFLNCLSCRDRKRIFEAIGAEEVECTQEDLGQIKGFQHSLTQECGVISNASLRSLKAFDKQTKQPFVQQRDMAKCIDAFRRLAALLNSTNIHSETMATFRSVGKFCDDQMSTVFPDYIVAEQRARHINERFLQEYASNSVDYEEFFSEIRDVAQDVARVLSTLARNPYENVISTLFTDQYLWGAFYIYLHEEHYRKEHYRNGRWQRFNPYRDLAYVHMEQFMVQILTEMAKAPTIEAKPFRLRRIKLTSSRLFAASAEFLSLGPAGCLMVKNITLKERYPVHAICETEVRRGQLYLWTWTDMAAEQNRYNSYLIDTPYWPRCKVVVYKIDPKKAKGFAVAEIDTPPGWNMLPSRKMAFATDRKRILFREYYLKDEHTIGSVDIERPLAFGMQSLLSGSMATFAQTNINNVIWERTTRFNHASPPALPTHLLNKHDLTPDQANIFFARPPIAPTFL